MSHLENWKEYGKAAEQGTDVFEIHEKIYGTYVDSKGGKPTESGPKHLPGEPSPFVVGAKK